MKIVFPFLAVAVLLFSCSGLHEAGRGTALEKPSDDRARDRISGHLNRQEYEKALKAIREERNNGKAELVFGAEYVKAMNGLIGKGMELFAAGNFERAGMTLRAALDSYPSAASIRGRLKLPHKQVEALLGECAGKLMEEGLVSYRQGNLKIAIDTWEKIRKFDPGNEEAKKALETATTQLKNLNKID